MADTATVTLTDTGEYETKAIAVVYSDDGTDLPDFTEDPENNATVIYLHADHADTIADRLHGAAEYVRSNAKTK